MDHHLTFDGILNDSTICLTVEQILVVTARTAGTSRIAQRSDHMRTIKSIGGLTELNAHRCRRFNVASRREVRDIGCLAHLLGSIIKHFPRYGIAILILGLPRAGIAVMIPTNQTEGRTPRQKLDSGKRRLMSNTALGACISFKRSLEGRLRSQSWTGPEESK